MWPHKLVVTGCIIFAETWFESEGPCHSHSTLVWTVDLKQGCSLASSHARNCKWDPSCTNQKNIWKQSKYLLYLFCGYNHIHLASTLQLKVAWNTLGLIWRCEKPCWHFSIQLLKYPLKTYRGRKEKRKKRGSHPYIKHYYWWRDDNTRWDEPLSPLTRIPQPMKAKPHVEGVAFSLSQAPRHIRVFSCCCHIFCISYTQGTLSQSEGHSWNAAGGTRICSCLPCSRPVFLNHSTVTWHTRILWYNVKCVVKKTQFHLIGPRNCF